MMQHEMQHDTPYARMIPKLSRGSTPLGSTKRDSGEHHADCLHGRRSVRLSLSAMCGEIKKEAAMQGIPCVAASFCFAPML